MPTQPDPNSRPKSAPEIEPAPGTPPKRFPEHPTPRSGGRDDAAKKSAQESTDGPGGDSARVGGGEDPDIESGVDHHDPEQQAAGDDSVEKSYD